MHTLKSIIGSYKSIIDLSLSIIDTYQHLTIAIIVAIAIAT